jgi:hypothetical protein
MIVKAIFFTFQYHPAVTAFIASTALGVIKIKVSDCQAVESFFVTECPQ